MITSISIPIHSTSSNPTPHVIYRIKIHDTVNGKYTVWKRYSDFQKLDSALKALTTSPSISLPPKGTLCTHFLDDDFIANRKKGLEDYLRSLIMGRLQDTLKELKNHESKVKEKLRHFLEKPGDSNKPDDSKKSDPSRGTNSLRPAARGWKFKGANCYYLHTFNSGSRNEVLKAVKDGGFTVVRIFIGRAGANNKGSDNTSVNDLEPNEVGSYDDSVLNMIDQLMLECSQLGIKLIIACHDRYSLAFFDTDVYATTFGVADPNSSGPQEISDASAFYTKDDAMAAFDNRIDHILNHKNSKMDNKPWSSLGSVIYSFEAENEPMGHMDYVSSSWIPDRSGRIKQNLDPDSGILISNGGGIDIATSITDEHLSMSNVDVVCVHDYGTKPFDTMAKVSAAAGTATENGKTLIFEEWGAMGDSKPDVLYAYVEALWSYGIDWLFWEADKPGAGKANYETWTDEPSWSSITHQPSDD